MDYTIHSFHQEFNTIDNSLSSFRIHLAFLQHQLRTLDKNVRREIKKKADKNKFKTNRKPYGFAKPSKISSQLSSFMHIDEGSLIARTEVTQYIINYVKEHKLAVSKHIHPDNKLKQLLEINDDDEVTYFNIQKYLNKHFIKADYTDQSV